MTYHHEYDNAGTDRPARSGDILLIAQTIFDFFRNHPAAMVIGAVETRRTAVDGEFDLIALAEAINSR